MDKNYMLNKIEEKFTNESKKIIINQFKLFLEINELSIMSQKKYNVGEEVVLKKGTLLHGTYKNLEGLKYISKTGLVASDFINDRKSKYPACVSVWNLKQDYKLKDYINFYSGATIKYSGVMIDNEYSQKVETKVIKHDELNHLTNILKNKPCRIWSMEQTKEIRFMPSLMQDTVQIGIIFKNNQHVMKLLNNGDILDENIVDDYTVKEFVSSEYYDRFINDRKVKDDFFTDRESAILYGIPANCIDGILVGRDYEKNNDILKEIKDILPNVYICNLDGKIILAN